jgi:hypothetical protein
VVKERQLAHVALEEIRDRVSQITRTFQRD